MPTDAEWERVEVTQHVCDAAGDLFGGYVTAGRRRYVFTTRDLCRDGTTCDRVAVGAMVWRRSDGALSWRDPATVKPFDVRAIIAENAKQLAATIDARAEEMVYRDIYGPKSL